MKKHLLTSLGLAAVAALSAQAQSILVNSWENSLEGWGSLEGNWTAGGFSTTTGVTAGAYSLQFNAASGPDYGAALGGTYSANLTHLLANAASVSVDVVDTGFSYMQWDLVIDQPQSSTGFGLGYTSVDGYSYSQSPSGATQSTLTYTISPSIRQALQDNPTLPSRLVFQIGGGNGGSVYMDNLRITPIANAATPAPAPLYIRETWDGVPNAAYIGYQPFTNDISSAGFMPTVPWIANPHENGKNGAPTNTSIFSVRNFIPKPSNIGLPTTLAISGVPATPATLNQDNSGGPMGITTLWSAGDWLVRPMLQTNAINFLAEGEYWFAFTYGDSFDAIYGGEVPSSGAGGIGIADGADTNANFVAFGVTATNLFLGPADGSHPFGTIEATKSVYISQGTLGQPGNPNSLIYSPANDPNLWPILDNNTVKHNPTSQSIQTNFTGGPYFVNAYGTNRQGQAFGNEILVLGHLTTHASGNATMDTKFYNYANGDQLDLTPSGITWDCSYSFHYTNTMAYFLLFENGEFPFDIYSFRAGSTLANVVGIDPGAIYVSPLADTYVGYPIDMTCLSAEAAASSSSSFPADYTGTVNYQWYQNGQAISGANSLTLDVASASLSDPSMPAGTDAGAYTCVSTDPSGFWGSVTTAPVVVTVQNAVAPKIAKVQTYADLATIQVTFDEPVTGADNPANYSLSGGLVVSSVTVSNLGQTTVAQLRTSPEPEGAAVTLTVNGVVNVNSQSVSPNTATFHTMMEAPGVANWDAWSAASTGGNNPSYYNTFLPNIPYPFVGTNSVVTSWDGAPGGASLNGNFGGRLYGWFTAPATTNYVFFCCADDACRLSLSTNSDPAHLCVIAAESLWSATDQWTNTSDQFPTGPHRGDGTATGVSATSGYVWDNSVAAQNPATACDQNRSDQFVVAYNDSLNGVGGWSSTALSQVTDVVLPGTPFWPTVDANGQAQIHLVAGQKYFMQAEYYQGGGGFNLNVTYKYAGAPDPNSPSGTIITAASGTMTGMVAFAPSVSVALDGNGRPVITFTGTLQSSSTVQGGYADVPGAGSPFHPTGGTTFFRAH
jgi:hypothetical protein